MYREITATALLSVTYLTLVAWCELHTRDESFRSLYGATFISDVHHLPHCGGLGPTKTYRGEAGAATRGNWVTHKP